jgi:REP element-mobilizing transposase RayT
MAYTSLLYHVVFATKDRRNSMPEKELPRIWSYMGGIARQNGFKLLAAGGIEDHAHLLLSLPATVPIAKAVQLIKAGSSKWIHEELGKPVFAWQESYGAFTIGISQMQATRKYIARQREHHKRHEFSSEWKAVLERHGLKEYEA